MKMLLFLNNFWVGHNPLTPHPLEYALATTIIQYYYQ